MERFTCGAMGCGFCTKPIGLEFHRNEIYWAMTFNAVRVFAIAGFVLGVVQSGHSQVSKGNQILINRGLQLQCLSQDDCYLHLDTVTNANYTSITWVNSPPPGGHS